MYFIFIHHYLIDVPDEDRKSVKDRSKTIKTPVEITVNANGEPEIPFIGVPDRSSHGAKVVQIALRSYLLAHIRELFLHLI